MSASRPSQPAVEGRVLSEGLGGTLLRARTLLYAAMDSEVLTTSCRFLLHVSTGALDRRAVLAVAPPGNGGVGGAE